MLHDSIPSSTSGKVSPICDCVHEWHCYCQANTLFRSCLVLLILFSLVGWSEKQKEKVAATSQSGIHAAVRTVLCQLLFLHNRISDSQRNWENRGVFQ